MIELVILGMGVGLLSGFFGIGGGTILVPLLLIFGYVMKEAIGISIVQMVFSSIYGSYLNHKKGSLDISLISFIGIGGAFGAMLSGFIVTYVSDTILELLFLSFALFALTRLFSVTHEHTKQKKINKIYLVFIGIPLGALSMSIGVGGSILLVPILVSFLYFPLKKATSAGLFFVVFSSIAGLISHSQQGSIDYESGIIIGLSSLLGVYVGVHLKDKIKTTLQRKMLAIFYLLIVAYLTQRIII